MGILIGTERSESCCIFSRQAEEFGGGIDLVLSVLCASLQSLGFAAGKIIFQGLGSAGLTVGLNDL